MRGEVHILVHCPIDTLQWGSTHSGNAGIRPGEGLLLNLDEQGLVDDHLIKGLKSEPDPLHPQHLFKALENTE